MKISVVIPSYNQAAFLPATLESVCAQSWTDREIIVIDGASTDGSVDILKNHPGGIEWVSEPDRGQTHAINKGLARADGEILTYLNSDDVYYEGALETAACFFASHPSCRILYGRADHLHADGSVMEPYPTEPWNYERLLDVCFLCQPAVFWRREIMDRFGLLDETLDYVMDYEYWLRIGRRIPFDYLDTATLAGSRLHPGTKTLSQRWKVHYETLSMVRRFTDRPYKWLRNLAQVTCLDRYPDIEEDRSLGRPFTRLYIERVETYAREFQIPLDAAMEAELTELRARLGNP